MEKEDRRKAKPFTGPPLMLVTDRTLFKDEDLLRPVGEALEGGVRLVQLREKDMGGRALLDLARRLRDVTALYGAGLIINDRVDAALLSGADGVHLGQNSFSPMDIRGFLSEGLSIGVSTHSLEEALKAGEEGADYITLGPVFKTPSKERYGRPLGIDALKEVKKRVNIPVYAIGGINGENIKEVLGAGAYGAAVISAILKARDIRGSVRELIERI